MKLESALLSLLALSVLLVGCNDESAREVVNTMDEDNSNEDVYENKDMTNTSENESANENNNIVDNNIYPQSGSTVPSIDIFKEVSNYPEDLSKTRYSREVRDIQTADGGWFITAYDDNHNLFITQDRDNEYKLTTKHGLLIFDSETLYKYGEKEWTNYYFKGIYFNEETNQFELKFVVDSKQKEAFVTVGLESLHFNGLSVDASHITNDYSNWVKPNEVQLFTVYVDKTDEYPLDIDTISFDFKPYAYSNIDKFEDEPGGIFMELSR